MWFNFSDNAKYIPTHTYDRYLTEIKIKLLHQMWYNKARNNLSLVVTITLNWLHNIAEKKRKLFRRVYVFIDKTAKIKLHRYVIRKTVFLASRNTKLNKYCATFFYNRYLYTSFNQNKVAGLRDTFFDRHPRKIKYKASNYIMTKHERLLQNYKIHVSTKEKTKKLNLFDRY